MSGYVVFAFLFECMYILSLSSPQGQHFCFYLSSVIIYHGDPLMDFIHIGPDDRYNS